MITKEEIEIYSVKGRPENEYLGDEYSFGKRMFTVKFMIRGFIKCKANMKASIPLSDLGEHIAYFINNGEKETK